MTERINTENNQDVEEDYDLGFGEKFNLSHSRLMNADGSYNIVREGGTRSNFFRMMVNTTWPRFFLYLIILYLLLNLVIALLYAVGDGNGIQGIEHGTFWRELEQMFYLSVHTFTTVGYGRVNPVSSYANMVTVFNAFFGLMYFSMATGLFFSKFSKPRSNIRFSKNILVTPHQGGKALMLRVVSTSDNHITDLSARVTMTYLIDSAQGKRRRFQLLDLEIDNIYLFPMNWTLVHAIDEKSPLKDKDLQEIKDMKMEIIVMIRGYDNDYAKQIHTNRSYVFSDFVDGAYFNPMYTFKNDKTTLYPDRIDDYSLSDKDG